MRITFVQFGDYREAATRLAQGGEETYYAQRDSVEFVANLTRKAEDVCVICVNAEPYNEMLPSGVRAIGLRPGHTAYMHMHGLVRVVSEQNPTHLVVCSPLYPVLRWAVRADIRALALFADSFEARDLLSRVRHKRLAAVLNRDQFRWVANHNINASRSLERIGVNPAKIIPWDFPPPVTPDDFEAKPAPAFGGPFRLVCVGAVTEAKGVGDCIAAVRILHAQHAPVTLTVAGTGPHLETFKSRVEAAGLDDAIAFLGRVPHSGIVQLMREHDAVVAPSRHEYAEGLPFTIYEAFSARTPLIVSDHPMFQGKVEDGHSGIIFPARDPKALADRIQRLRSRPDLYEAISQNAKVAWQRLQCPVKFDDLLTRWIDNTPDDRAYLNAHTLKSEELQRKSFRDSHS